MFACYKNPTDLVYDCSVAGSIYCAKPLVCAGLAFMGIMLLAWVSPFGSMIYVPLSHSSGAWQAPACCIQVKD
jgi:hypothetical protein